MLAPTDPFATEAAAPDRLVVSPRAHARDDSLAQTFASLDTRDHPPAATPAVEATTAVPPSAVMYTYVDPRLEELSPAQQQLLRMGPRNVRIVRQKLREIAAALGIPADRLPPLQGGS